MTRMTGPDCAVMCNLINTHLHIHTQTHTGQEQGRGWRPVDESSSGDGNGGGNENIIREDGRGKTAQETVKSCRRHVGNGGDLGGRRK